ncbi:GMC family oxidoreductase [Sphingomonas bacterium]|uniref:GMC family oxidoreductase n=1 Tax=Sphingomonas bacterium TaxID=1895847 RepID=UPI001C2D3781|nr:GMC family oxidoreductase N-terminal domain-containing protein [Sphingomonas bacterium]
MSASHDVIVIGGGSAGCLIAGRLAQETEADVLLLEAGGRDLDPLIHIPSGFSKLLQNGWFLWPYESVPQTQLDGKPRLMHQGKGLGGGGSINAMLYVRGQPRDYARWQEAVSDTGQWSYADLLPHFIAMEGNDSFAGPLHGAEGPLKVSQPIEINALNRAAMDGFTQAGLPYNADYNGEGQRGVGPCKLTIGDARRCSAADAFLNPAQSRPNLTINTHCLVTNIVFDGDRAIGVDYVHGGDTHRALAGEVVISAGALNSPRLLMLSGVGPEAELARHGIGLRLASPDVGQHLQEHPAVPISARSRHEMGYARYATGLPMLGAGALYLLTGHGPAATNGIESVAFFNPDDPAGEPTVQCMHLAVAGNPTDQAGLTSGLTLENVVIQPRSRGFVGLRDADPTSAPVFDPNYLGDPEDMRVMVASLRYCREVLQTPALRDIMEFELSPGPDVNTDEGLIEHCKRTLTVNWHPVGTCRMGADDEAVVDASLRVRGARNLWVMDASIMPNITSGNTNAPTMAIASKGVDLLKVALRA